MWGKNKKIFNDFIAPYLMLMKYASWEFTLFFVLLMIFFNNVLEYLVAIFTDLYNNTGILIENSSYILISVAILLLFSFLANSYYWAIKKNDNESKIAMIICILIIQALILSANIYKGLTSNNVNWAGHDGIKQTEVAMNYFVAGKNPYEENYYGTIMDNGHDHFLKMNNLQKKWTMLNPALESYVYLPLNFILPIPFKYLFENIFHFYDNRIFNFIIYLLSFLLIYKITEDKNKKKFMLIFFGLNFFVYRDLIFGYNDIVTIFFSLISYHFLKNKRYTLSIIWITLAGLIKQNLIFFWPFFLAYILFKKYLPLTKRSLLKFIKYPLIILLLICAILLPFILWCPNCFYHDTIYYLNNLYPARGIGLAGLLLNLNIIKHPLDHFNFMIWQVIFLLIFLPLLLYKQYKNNTPKNAYLYSTLLMGGVWFFSRNFTEGHLDVILTNLIITLFL